MKSLLGRREYCAYVRPQFAGKAFQLHYFHVDELISHLQWHCLCKTTRTSMVIHTRRPSSRSTFPSGVPEKH